MREDLLISQLSPLEESASYHYDPKYFTSSPGGNLVDGLPPAANTGAGVIGQRVGRDKCVVNRPLA